MSDGAQTIVWDHVTRPFGETVSLLGVFENNRRFPGQYFDSETELHYNYFRDYDPALGRYVQSDPIGLRGGLNTYAYVGGKPTRFSDSLGLYFWNDVPPITVPVSGSTATQLQCIEDCLKANGDHDGRGLLCTGGQEQKGHSRGSCHYTNDAVDIAGPEFNDYSDGDVLSCAARCGFKYGWFEDKPGGYSSDHWHVQNRRCGNVPPLPLVGVPLPGEKPSPPFNMWEIY